MEAQCDTYVVIRLTIIGTCTYLKDYQLVLQLPSMQWHLVIHLISTVKVNNIHLSLAEEYRCPIC